MCCVCFSLSSYFASPHSSWRRRCHRSRKGQGSGVTLCSLYLSNSLPPARSPAPPHSVCEFDAKMTKPVRSLGCYRAASGGGGDNVRPEYKFRLRSPHGTKNRRVSSLFLAVVVVNDYISHVPLHLEYHTMYYCGRGRLGAQEPPRKGRS